MSPRGHRRQILLFLVAVLVPCVVLIALTVRMLRQERELTEKRLAEERQRIISQTRQELLARLERIKLAEATALANQKDSSRLEPHQNRATELVATVENDRLVLPWERHPAGEEFRRAVGEAAFAERIRRAEREELVAGQASRAAEGYQDALTTARHPSQAAYARLLLARALAKAGRGGEAEAHYRKLLALPLGVVDEQGVPLALYAAVRLVDAGAEPKVLDHVRLAASRGGWHGPAESYLLRDLAGRLGAADVEEKVREHVRRMEQALALQKDFGRLPRGASEPVWITHGNPAWLVGVAPALGESAPAVVAVDAARVFASLDVAGVRLVAGPDPKGAPLGASLPGVRVAFAAGDSDAAANQGNLQRYFYFVALLVVVSVALFGAYLLFRDVRRELRMAEMRSQFVSSVSHELKTPLTAIRMFAETLWLGRSPDPRAQGEYLETIVNESERLTRLVDNVLDFSKIEQGKKIYDLRPVPLPEIVHAAARAVRYPLAQQGFELRVDVEEGLPPVRADRDALEQAILNLLTNAMKYSGDSRAIDLRAARENGRALIQVTDRGLGIAPEEHARIFEKFYRASTRENRLVPGTGLGLTLVAHVAQAHGGMVEVRSAPGEGSTFSIRLPLENEA